MPNGLKNFHVANTPIKNLPVLPIGIESIYASSTDITELPQIYTGIINISVPGSKLKRLPFKHMPSTLKNLDISGTDVRVLPVLGRGLTHLNISNTQISVLPPFPLGLQSLFCANCDLAVPADGLELGGNLANIREYGLRWLDWHYLALEKERAFGRCKRIKYELYKNTFWSDA